MKLHFPLLLAPALALAATFSGTIVALDGTPISGAVIKMGVDSVTTTPNGSWVLARTAGIVSRSGKAMASTPIRPSFDISQLTVQHSRPRLSFGGLDIAGRSSHRSLFEQISSNALVARNQSTSDTLKVYWKGKRLTVLPVPSDTGSITFSIDTAWKDDAGIPWNPRIVYSSLLDSRDSQTYRAITIGGQTWMAENLNFAVDSSWWYNNSPDSGKKYGRLYRWITATQFDDSCVSRKCADQALGVKGICPDNWHMPSDSQWNVLMATAGSGREGIVLKATSGWKLDNQFPASGIDSLGFRGLPSAYRYSTGGFNNAGNYGDWLSTLDSTDNTGSYASYRAFTYSTPISFRYFEIKTVAFAIRCVKD